MTALMMLKKKRYKFQVDLCLDELSEVSYSKGILFAKIRQLDGGNFIDVSKRKEVLKHRVQYSARFLFPCRMQAAASSGVLETCKCRISMRMEEKGGRHFRKLGFADVNLAEYAGAGPTTQRYILQAYDQNHRLDNSIVKITLNVTLKEGDTIFQRPLTRQQPISLPGEDASSKSRLSSGEETAPDASSSASDPSMVSTKSSTTSLQSQQQNLASNRTKKKLSDPLVSASMGADGNHSRNSSAASQQSSIGYASQNSQPTTAAAATAAAAAAANAATTATAPTSKEGQVHSRQSSEGTASSHGRNLSQGSSDTGYFGGSLEKEQRRKRKQLDEGRVDAEAVINELMEQAHLDKVVQGEESVSLQLFVRKDGSVTFDQVSSATDAQPVVIEAPPR